MSPNVIKELIKDIDILDIPKKYRNIAEVIGLENYLELCNYAKGDEIYFPKRESILIPARNRKIQKEYNGWNSKLLAEKYDLTTQQIRAIIKNIPAPEQMNLFSYGIEANIDI